MPAQGALLLNSADNVATALAHLERGQVVPVRLGREVFAVEALEPVPFGFKIAVTDIAKGERVIKYGEAIGLASSNIRRGEKVHIHNLEGARGRGDLARGGGQ